MHNLMDEKAPPARGSVRRSPFTIGELIAIVAILGIMALTVGISASAIWAVA